MEEVITKTLVVYGPLGLGWVAAWYLLKQLQDLHGKVMAAFVADTELKVSLQASIDNLIEVVKREVR